MQLTAVQAARAVQTAQRTGAAVSSGRASALDSPVEPVSPVSPVDVNGANGISQAIPFLRKGMDPAELAVRMRIQYMDPAQEEEAAGVEGAQKAFEKGECKTCRERKYQDGSDDAGVSYQTPTHIAPEQAASAVMGHEMEHVVREQAKAEREDRKVVSQSVTMHTAVCPECGRVYVSGGTTRTTTVGTEDTGMEDASSGQKKQPRTPFDAVA